VKIAYIITAYQDPQQLGRLVHALDYQGKTSFFIHIDKKVDIAPFRNKCKAEDLTFIKDREWVSWAGFSQVKSLVKLLCCVFQRSEFFDRIVCISGTDYPVCSNQKIFEEFDTHSDLQYIIAHNISQSKNRAKISQYWLCDFKVKSRFIWKCWYHASSKILKFLSKVIGRRTKIFLNGSLCDVWFSSDYWALTNDCALYLLNTFNENKKFQQEMKYYFAPSELWAATIICNSKFKNSIVKIFEDAPEVSDVTPLSYLEYYSTGVRVMNETDLKKILNSKKIFFRKAASVVSDELLTVIDQLRNRGC